MNPLHIPYKVVLASRSPRRHELLRGLGIDFEVRSGDVDESFPAHLQGAAIAEYLSEKKADAFMPGLGEAELLVTADTIVWLGNEVFNKPSDREDAIEMIATLSGQMHEVHTAITIATHDHRIAFSECTRVHFGQLNRDDIAWYVDTYQPYDKAGAYGIQEWIGYVGIDRIEGSFYNVMGFPTRKFYTELTNFLK